MKVPRQPDLKNKSNRLVYVPTDPCEIKLAQDVKALCIQDGIIIRDFLSEAITLAFRVHHWPPGNPQLTLSNYQVKPLVFLGKCGFLGCKNNAAGVGVYLPSQKTYQLCRRHLAEAKNSSKIWRL